MPTATLVDPQQFVKDCVKQVSAIATLPEVTAKIVTTVEEIGKPQGPSPVGQVIGYQGGTYELLPGEPRRYRIVSADGRDISSKSIVTPGRHQTADNARTVIRVDAFDHAMVVADQGSTWRKALGEVTGSWSYDTRDIDGFDAATPAERDAIRTALNHWTTDKINVGDDTRQAEPRVNTVLRGAAPREGVADQDITALDHAFTMSRTKTPITVYRGFTNGTHILPEDWQTTDLTGLEWSSDGFTPTSGGEDLADAYIGNAQDRGFGIRLNLPEGFPAIAIPDAIGGMDNEGEIVLPRGLKFRTVKDNGSQTSNGRRWLDVEVTLDPAR